MTQETMQVWRPGRNGGIEFGNIKLLETQEPNTYKLITWIEGFETNDHNYHYKVGKSKFGLWISRKLVTTENLQAMATSVIPNAIKNIEENSLPKTSQSANPVIDDTNEMQQLTAAILELAAAIRAGHIHG